MDSKQIFSKTMPFVWAKLALGGAMVLISVLLLAIFMGLGWLFGNTAMILMFGLWVGATGVVRFAIMRYAGYMVKAGHIAVIAEAYASGRVPANQVEYGKNAVLQRFVDANVYYAVDELVTGAIKEIQKSIGKVSNALDFIPGIEAVAGAAQFFVSIALGYVDECCFAWSFMHKNQNAFKSAADGVVIYAQNWKVLLKSAAQTLLKTLLLTVVLALLIFVPIGIVFKILHLSGLAAFLLACLIAWVVKFAVMDSYIMIEMMSSYLTVAPATVITFDLYSKLAGVSSKFKELWTKSGETAPHPAYTASRPLPANAAPAAAAPAVNKPVFCGQCGAKNDAGTKFCGNCGAKMQ